MNKATMENMHDFKDTHVHIFGKTIILLIGAIGRMVFLITMLLEDEDKIKLTLAEGT